jgi:hypothetical protein
MEISGSEGWWNPEGAFFHAPGFTLPSGPPLTFDAEILVRRGRRGMLALPAGHGPVEEILDDVTGRFAHDLGCRDEKPSGSIFDQVKAETTVM